VDVEHMLGRKTPDAVARELSHRLGILEQLEALEYRFPESAPVVVYLHEFNQGIEPRDVETHLRRIEEDNVMSYKVIRSGGIEPWNAMLAISAVDIRKLTHEKKKAETGIRRQAGHESAFGRVARKHWVKIPKLVKVAAAIIGGLGTVAGAIWVILNLTALVSPGVNHWMHPPQTTVVQTFSPASTRHP
jgi:hypothetical protein